MSGVAVVTDTTQYLPQDVVDRHGLSLVSLYVNWNGRTDRESDMPTYDAFYDYLRASAATCRARRSRRSATSWRSTSRWSSAATTSSRSTSPAASRHGALRGAGARRARRARRGRGRIVVLDSRTGCAGHGLMAIAADQRRQGRRRRAGRRGRSRRARETG